MISLNLGSNIRIVCSALRFFRYGMFAATVDCMHPEPDHWALDTHIISDMDTSMDQTTPDLFAQSNSQASHVHVIPPDNPEMEEKPAPSINFDKGAHKTGDFMCLQDDDAIQSRDSQAELFNWHYCLGHTSFKTLQVMAKQGFFPRALMKIDAPKCTGCLYGKATR